MTAPLFLAPTAALSGDVVVLDGDEGRHAADVRRLTVGEAVTVADGCGLIVRGVVTDVARGRLLLSVQFRESVPAPDPRFVVVQALAKGGRDEDAVEAMTEVGVDEVVAWSSSRSIAKWTDRTGAKWSATARAAAKQSRRAWVPAVTGPASTADVAARLSHAALAVVLHEEATSSLPALDLPVAGDVTVVVGPEGGIAPDELDAFVAAGAVACRVGSGVLRSSTAGVAALSVLSARSRWR